MSDEEAREIMNDTTPPMIVEPQMPGDSNNITVGTDSQSESRRGYGGIGLCGSATAAESQIDDGNPMEIGSFMWTAAYGSSSSSTSSVVVPGLTLLNKSLTSWIVNVCPKTGSEQIDNAN